MTAPRMYHDGSLHFQDHFDTRRLADRIEERLIRSTIGDDERTFIERLDMFFLATADAAGRPQCSYKGGDPGFVRVLDEHTLAFPSFDGNGMYLSLGNLRVNPHVGLLFIDFMKGWRLRIHGDARLCYEDPLLPNYPEAQFIIRITVKEAFGNCPRYIHKYQLVERSSYVPKAGCETPVPEWKKHADAQEVPPKSTSG